MTTRAASTIHKVLLREVDVFTGLGLLKSFVMLLLLSTLTPLRAICSIARDLAPDDVVAT